MAEDILAVTLAVLQGMSKGSGKSVGLALALVHASWNIGRPGQVIQLCMFGICLLG